MISAYKIWLLSFLLLALHIQQCRQDAPLQEAEDETTMVEATNSLPNPDDETFETNSEITRQVLITHCGSCHQSSLPTHKAAAIAFFDLDKEALWHEDLTAHDLPGITNRVKNKSSITEEQQMAIAAFIERKGELLDSSPQK